MKQEHLLIIQNDVVFLQYTNYYFLYNDYGVISMNKLTREQFMQIRNWMYRNARPLDIGRWKYHFENGAREDVVAALSAYQNPDGGFAYALEADSWNPNSSPIQTWCATEILYELGITDKNNEIVKGILSYLDSKKDFQNGYWLAEIPSNNDYPHADWWHYGENVIEEWGYNPTICLVGFILYFADKESQLYQLAAEIAKKAANTFIQNEHAEDMHEILCFIRLYEYCEKAGISGLFDSEKMRSCLKKKVKSSIGDSKEDWKDSYMCKPSQFMITPDSIFYMDNKELADYEADFIIETMNPNGTWNIVWNWSEYPEEWAISKNWWMASLILANLRYLKSFHRL